MTKSDKMQLVQVVELLRQGNIEALTHVPTDLVKTAAGILQAERAKGARKIGVKVYAESGSIGITGIRTRPVVLYKGEWEAVTTYITTEAFGKAMSDPLASTGSDDPRYADYREKAKAKREVERKARTT